MFVRRIMNLCRVECPQYSRYISCRVAQRSTIQINQITISYLLLVAHTCHLIHMCSLTSRVTWRLLREISTIRSQSLICIKAQWSLDLNERLLFMWFSGLKFACKIYFSKFWEHFVLITLVALVYIHVCTCTFMLEKWPCVCITM